MPAHDGEPEHHVAIVDRYGQVYEAISARHVESLPDAEALEDWFRFPSQPHARNAELSTI